MDRDKELRSRVKKILENLFIDKEESLADKIRRNIEDTNEPSDNEVRFDITLSSYANEGRSWRNKSTNPVEPEKSRDSVYRKLGEMERLVLDSQSKYRFISHIIRNESNEDIRVDMEERTMSENRYKFYETLEIPEIIEYLNYRYKNRAKLK